MRRTVALIALLITAWPHAVALECVAAHDDGSDHGAHHAGHAPLSADTEGRPAGHGGHADGHHGHPADHDAEAPVDGAACAMVMACGLVMAEARAEPAVTEVADSGERTPTSAPSLHGDADLGAEPPPPRRNT